MFKYGFILSFLLLGVSVGAVCADSPDVEADLQYLSNNSMSPFCPGLTLSACPSPDATELRNEMRGWLEAGYSIEAVQNQLKMRFGDTVLGVPKAHGLGWLIWIIPAIFVLVGFLVVGIFVRRSAEEGASQRAGAVLDPRVEQELRRRILGE